MVVAACTHVPLSAPPSTLAAHAHGTEVVGIGLFGAAATVASVACLAVCHDPGGWAYVGTGIAVTAFVVPLSTAF